MTAPLPRWADNPEARALLAAIVAEEPDFAAVRNAFDSVQRDRRYKGANAKALRSMFEAEYDRQMDEYARGKNRDAILAELTPSADVLIERMLAAKDARVAADPIARAA